MSRTLVALVASLVLVTVPLTGCLDTLEPGPPRSTFTATADGFQAPDELRPGVHELVLDNQGSDIHHLQIVRLHEDHTAGELLSYLAEQGQQTPAWATEEGGPNAAMPGSSSSAFVDLAPGSYVAVDVIPDPDGIPHIQSGFHHAFEVTGEPTGASVPEPDATVRLVDFAFDGTDRLDAGDRVIRAVNDGDQPHEITVVRLDEGATAESFLLGFGPNATGPPPGTFVGGITGIEPGEAQSFRVELEPGSYAAICFLPDVTDEAATLHFIKGMVTQFTVS